MSDKAYITLYERHTSDEDGTKNEVYTDIIGVSLSAETAKITFEMYLNMHESNWRQEDGSSITKDNTFNRFSEPTKEFLFSADLKRGNDQHYAYVKQFDLD